MSIMKRTSIYLHSALLGLAYASSAFAADPVAPQPYPCLWWSGTQWPAFGWVFPLVCFVVMGAMLFFMMRRGGMGCMSHGDSPHKTRAGDPMKRSWSGPPASAQEILNDRYAKGEIDKQEYEEKKAAIASPV